MDTLKVIEARANLLLQEKDRFKKEAIKIPDYLKEKGISHAYIIRGLNICRATFYERIKDGDWKEEEIFKIIRLIKEKETGNYK